jgi:hypothetical protein
MGFFDRLRSALTAAPTPKAQDGRNYWFYVRCAACGEVIRGRIDLYNELSQRDDAAGYIVRKTVIGSQRCYRAVEATFYFDANRRLTEQEIRGGEFVSADDTPPAA